MITIEPATLPDVKVLVDIQTRCFDDDNKLKPAGSSLDGPPGYDSIEWNMRCITTATYFKILSESRIVGGLIAFDMGHGHFVLGRIYVDPEFQNQGIGQQVIALVFEMFPEAKQWTLDTPAWAIRNQHVYEKLGFVRLRETEVDPACGWASIEYERQCDESE